MSALIYDFGGLVTAPGLLARNPASCVDVLNFRFPSPGVMRKRTGFSLGAYATGGNDCFTSLLSSKTLGRRLLAWSPTTGLKVGGPSDAWAGVTADSTVINGAAAARMRMGVLGPGHYVCGGGGVMRLESGLATAYGAGMTRGLAPTTYSMNAAVYAVLTAGAMLANGSNVAYRVTWHRKDESGNYELGGPPSSRLVIRNIAGTSGFAGAGAQVTLRIPLPFRQDTANVIDTTTPTHFWRLWRSRTSATDTADDEMYLVAEAFVTAADSAAGYAVVTDATPDLLLQTAPKLHTNASNFPPLEAGLQNGQTNADEAPPYASDLAVFAGCMFYAAPTWRAFQSLTLIALPAVNDTLTIADGLGGATVTLTCVAGAPAAAGQFTLVAGLATLSLNIEATVRNMVDAFTRAVTTSGFKCLSLSQGTQQPGQFAFEAKLAVSTATMTLTPLNAGVGALFRPVIPAGGLVVSPTTQSNVVVFSKLNRPDAVPPVNQLTVGPSDSRIQRIIAFRERLLCFSDAGLYEVTGDSYANFTVSLVDSSLRLLGLQTVCVLEDRAYAWCKEGIAEISTSGRTIISASIEPTVQTILQAAKDSDGTPTGVSVGAFAVVNQKYHRIMFFYTSAAAPFYAYAQEWIEWDARERKWSKHNSLFGPVVGCGVTSYATDLPVLGNTQSNPEVPTAPARIFPERDSGTATDYNDTDASGTTTALVSVATFQFQVPDLGARQHWQRMVMLFENGEQSFFTTPTSVGLTYKTDAATGDASVTTTPTAALVKQETPRTHRRSTRLRVSLGHGPLAEPCGLVGLSMEMAEGRPSRFQK